MDMNSLSMTQRKAKPPLEPKQSRLADAAFDVWLQRGLHQLYDQIAREPIPDEMLKLIENDRKK